MATHIVAPIMAEEKQRTPPQQSVHPKPLKAVLVVDDDKQLASALEWILVDENYLVDVANDGEEALLKLKVHEYDVIICDLLMPRLRGDEFYLKANELRPDVGERFIFITGFATDSLNKEFLSRRGIRYLIKPFPINDLIAAVKELLDENA
jgi:DNA-binding response OmpR family regulator